MLRIIVYALLVVAAWKTYAVYQARQAVAAQQLLLDQPRHRDIDVGSAAAAKPQYTCDGRTYCAQMKSCEEATFFLRNCPGTKMDGDNDGIPCEQQLCR
jgi:hypothetical protein